MESQKRRYKKEQSSDDDDDDDDADVQEEISPGSAEQPSKPKSQRTSSGNIGLPSTVLRECHNGYQCKCPDFVGSRGMLPLTAFSSVNSDNEDRRATVISSTDRGHTGCIWYCDSCQSSRLLTIKISLKSSTSGPAHESDK